MEGWLLADPSSDSASATVVVTDDRPVMRHGLRLLVDAGSGRVVAAVARTAAPATVARTRPDLLVAGHLDPPDATVEVIRAARARHPAMAVLLVTDAASALDLREVVAAGATSILLTTASEQEIGEAVTATAAGGRVLAPELALSLAGPWREQRGPKPPAKTGPLTPRELEVLQLLTEGLTNDAIADELSISPRTAKTHVQNLIGKLEVPDRTAAVAQGFRRGLVR